MVLQTSKVKILSVALLILYSIFLFVIYQADNLLYMEQAEQKLSNVTQAYISQPTPAGREIVAAYAQNADRITIKRLSDDGSVSDGFSSGESPNVVSYVRRLEEGYVKASMMMNEKVSFKNGFFVMLAVVGSFLIAVILFLFNYFLNQLKGRLRESDAIKQSLESKANTDALTKCLNRRHFEQYVPRFIRHQAREKEVFLALIDLDYFKKINDEHGHDVGDEVLVEVSETLRGLLKNRCVNSSLYRMGGEEFLFVSACDSEAELVKELDVIYSEFSQKRISEKQLKIGLSIGIAALNGLDFGVDATSSESLSVALKRADMALYRAKDGGRNKYVITEDK